MRCRPLICRYGGDVFIISCAVSLFIPFSRKWLWVYIVIPLYFAYMGIKMVVNWALTPDPTPEVGFERLHEN